MMLFSRTLIYVWWWVICAFALLNALDLPHFPLNLFSLSLNNLWKSKFNAFLFLFDSRAIASLQIFFVYWTSTQKYFIWKKAVNIKAAAGYFFSLDYFPSMKIILNNSEGKYLRFFKREFYIMKWSVKYAPIKQSHFAKLCWGFFKHSIELYFSRALILNYA